MAFTDAQIRQLKAKLDPKHIKSREAAGATLHYIEAWHALAEANRIFGFDGWDRETVSTSCVWSGKSRGDYAVAYTAKVRVSVRAGDLVVVREGSGTGEATGVTPGRAHELALKSAETDATKRALASFGNAFGLALYDPEHSGVKRAANGRSGCREGLQTGPWVLRSRSGEQESSFEKAKDFAEALRGRLSEAASIEALFGIWEQNVQTVRALHRAYRRDPTDGADGIQLVAHLKARARRLGRGTRIASHEVHAEQDASIPSSVPTKIDKSVLTIGEPKRIRSKEHLRFVAQQPCLICGRSPSHAHHIRYAQPKGLALKVSDEFTVPLCASHHSENHATGDERRWWEERNCDPLQVANQLWLESQASRRLSAG